MTARPRHCPCRPLRRQMADFGDLRPLAKRESHHLVAPSRRRSDAREPTGTDRLPPKKQLTSDVDIYITRCVFLAVDPELRTAGLPSDHGPGATHDRGGAARAGRPTAVDPGARQHLADQPAHGGAKPTASSSGRAAWRCAAGWACSCAPGAYVSAGRLKTSPPASPRERDDSSSRRRRPGWTAWKP